MEGGLMKKMLARFIPETYQKMLSNIKILCFGYGQWKSIKENTCIDNQNNTLPWYTYPAIEYLKQLDFSERSVFEFGSGNSSLFWAARVRQIISVEDNRDWYALIDQKKHDNQTIILRETKEKYVSSISEWNKKFDIIIVDGKYRFECAQAALPHLNGDGMIILDNSDWHPRTAALLRSNDLIEIDFNGFGCINGYTWTTSLFLTRNFDPKLLNKSHPCCSVGGIDEKGENETIC